MSMELQRLEGDDVPVQEAAFMVEKEVIAIPKRRKVLVPKRRGEKRRITVFRIDDMFGQPLPMPGVGVFKGEKRKQEGDMGTMDSVAKRQKGE